MSHFIDTYQKSGEFLIEDKRWMDEIITMSTKECQAAYSFQNLISSYGYFPTYFQDKWANGDLKPFNYVQARAFSMRG